MYFTKFLLSIAFVLFASSALAGKAEKEPKPEKVLVCHVGSTKDSEGATNLKIDLISVSEKSKHIKDMGKDFPKHSYVDESGFEWVDFYPAEGVGDDPADFDDSNGDGIDDGCELEEEVVCPCAADTGDAGTSWRLALEAMRNDGVLTNGCYSNPPDAERWMFSTTTGSPGYVSSELYFVEYDIQKCKAQAPGGTIIGIDYVGTEEEKIDQHNACVSVLNEEFGIPSTDDCIL
jgi:hypothetical protein